MRLFALQHRPEIDQRRHVAIERCEQLRQPGIVGPHVEVAGQDRARCIWCRRIGVGAGLTWRLLPRRGHAVDLPDTLDLCGAEDGRGIFQMGRHHPDRAEGRLDHGLDQHARHVARRRRFPGQDMAQRLRHRQPRQDKIAEALAAARAIRNVDANSLDRCETRQQFAEQGELVGAVIAVEIGEIRRDLLQT